MPLQPPPPYRPPTVPKTSKFLTEHENEVLTTACKDRRWVVWALGLADVYKLDVNQERWHRAHSGVACFINDYAAHSHFIRLFDFNVNDFVCEFGKLFPDFTYNALLSYFHTFEADDCHVGLSFAYQEEAESFHAAVEKAWTRAEGRYYSKKDAQTSVHTPQVPCTPSQNIAQTSVAKGDPQVPCSADGTYNMPRRSIKKPQGKISKDNITQPMDFRHLQHVWWDPTKGFDLQYVVDFPLHKFSDLASVSPRDLADDPKQKFIYDLIERNGGIDALRDPLNPNADGAFNMHKGSIKETQGVISKDDIGHPMDFRHCKHVWFIPDFAERNGAIDALIDLLNPAVVSREAEPSVSPPTRRSPGRTSSLRSRCGQPLPNIQFPPPPPPMVRPRRLGKGDPPSPPLPMDSPQVDVDVPPTPLPRKLVAY